MNQPRKLRRSPQAQGTRVGDETILLTGKTEAYYGIEGAAEVVWNHLQDGDTAESLFKRIGKQYSIDDQSRKDLLSAVEMLVDIGALEDAGL